MKHRADAISKLLEGLDTIVAGHAKRTLEEDKGKKSESEGEQPIESTKEHVEKYEVEADLPEGHSEEAEEAAANKKVSSGGASILPLPEASPEEPSSGNASGMPMKKVSMQDIKQEPGSRMHAESEDSDEMSQAKRELMDRLSKKPKAIRR